METMQCCLVLLEMNPKDVAKLVPGWGNKIYACPGTVDVEGSVNVHSPVLGMIDQDRGLHIGPLSDEISERL
jgi:hypothetical protein